MTDQHTAKADALAEKITAKASDTLSALDREMVIMKWPAEFRAIMWHAVALEAMSRYHDAGNKGASQDFIK